MSRIGKQPVNIPSGVEVNITDGKIVVKGPKGTLDLDMHPLVSIDISDNEVKVTPKEDTKFARSLWGTYQRLISNMIIGVTNGFTKELEYNGIGWRVDVKGRKLILNLGYSHPIEYKIPDGIEITVDKNIITVSGIDKQLVGQTAAKIRSFRKPEPYKGKGIKYKDEVIIRKATKQVKGA